MHRLGGALRGAMPFFFGRGRDGWMGGWGGWTEGMDTDMDEYDYMTVAFRYRGGGNLCGWVYVEYW